MVSVPFLERKAFKEEVLTSSVRAAAQRAPSRPKSR
jgi:hypothetical protein